MVLSPTRAFPILGMIPVMMLNVLIAFGYQFCVHIFMHIV